MQLSALFFRHHYTGLSCLDYESDMIKNKHLTLKGMFILIIKGSILQLKNN